MDTRSAELTKYAANAMLATKISLMNEVANIAERIGADIELVRQGSAPIRASVTVHLRGDGIRRVLFFQMEALARTARQTGYEPQILPSVEAVNEAQKRRLFELMQGHFGTLAGRTIAVWGWRSSPTPMTCATRPLACCWSSFFPWAVRCAPTIRTRRAGRASAAPAPTWSCAKTL